MNSVIANHSNTTEAFNSENRVIKGKLSIAACLHDFINTQVLPGLAISSEQFWSGFQSIFEQCAPRNRELIDKRTALQDRIDQWHRDHPAPFDLQDYKQFLSQIGYFDQVDDSDNAHIDTDHVDDEIAHIAGPQLVVPVMNARFALNATNARWGSLYDALYGTDVLAPVSEIPSSGEYDEARGARVVSYSKGFLTEFFPFADSAGTAVPHTDITEYSVEGAQLVARGRGSENLTLIDTKQFVGYRGSPQAPEAILLVHNRLHVEILIDRSTQVGQLDLAGISDVLLESAITCIQDCEDSVAAVDAEDKTLVYSNWLGLMKGDLQESFVKGGKTLTRALNADRHYLSPNHDAFTLPGRSLLFVRNVGHLMQSDAVLHESLGEVPEGIMDGIVTATIALHDLNQTGPYRNSREGSIYIVKPKMHGAEEVAFTTDLFDQIEDFLKLRRNSIKLGIMDEERRTSVNLQACIQTARHRVVFINTGFLDRTGDEIHTSMLAGPMVAKGSMKQQSWIQAYENRNVDVGLNMGFKDQAQIGKGMWAMPDEMSKMMEAKIGHPQSGANTAWVPSPTAATLHAIHYHKVNVSQTQSELLARGVTSVDELLAVPIMSTNSVAELSDSDISDELDNNIQGLLGYVVRWIDQGVGCSKVPDINNIGLMEDRATLRISSQHLCNWLEHGVCTEEQIRSSLVKMAAVVDEQNQMDMNYQPMSDNLENSLAFQAACDLIFLGKEQPSGYTEPLLHHYRRLAKQQHT